MREKLREYYIHNKEKADSLPEGVIFMIKAIILIFILIVIAGIVAIISIVKVGNKNSGNNTVSSASKRAAPTISKKDANEMMDLIEALYELNK